MGGPVKPSEHQAEHVGHVPSRCGQARSAGGWGKGRQSAARWSTRSCGAHVWKRFRRRQRRAGHRNQGGTAPPTQRVTCDPQGACRPVEERAGVASRLCGDPPLGHDVRVNTRNRVLATPKSACHAVCAPSLSSWNFFQYGRPTAVRKPTCQALTQSCGRDRAMASATAVTLRGIPRRHGENVESTVRPRSTSESGTVQISSVTSSCTASSPKRSASIAERESVATGTRVGDRDAAARRGTGNRLLPRSVTGHSARQRHARLPAAAR
ncbi:mucin-associated surface protein (MASP) [Trypanosoma cruzi]|nr:mucin-associated surface protein (MASP) [Trypanosoma cruzi]